jgi:hypothetical protein
MRPGKVLAVQKNVKVCRSNLLAHLHAKEAGKPLLIGSSVWRTLKKEMNVRLMRTNKAVTEIKIADRIPFQIL